MSLDETREYAPPDYQTPKTFGILNVVFSILLMPCGLCLGFYAMLPPLMSLANEQIDRREAEQAAQRKVQVAAMIEEEKAAASDEVREGLKAKRAALEAKPIRDPDRPVFLSDPRLRDPVYIGHFAADLASGLVLNLIMLISGVGLIYLKGWGRSLAVAVSWLKIARLFALALSATLFVAPFLARVVSAIEADSIAADPKLAGTKAEMGPFVGLSLTAAAWALFVFGSIYPVLTIYFLGRPSVRQACRPKRPDGGDEVY